VTLGAPNPASVTLDKAGTWSFDFEVTTTAKSVSADQATTATVTVTAQNA
jgi:VCBS repeat-containing protein